MSEAKHTPGPWRVDGHAGRLEIVGRPNWKCRRFGVEGEWSVAVVDDLSEGQDGAEFETEANAHLISAAPEMLEALEQFMEEYVELVNSGDAGFWNPEDEDKVKVARAAISKAKGINPDE